MLDAIDPIASALAHALVHESSEKFVAQALPSVLKSDNFGMEGASESEGRLLLMTLFSALPRSGNHFKFVNATLPSRNDSCLCGSGKKFKKCCAHLNSIDLPPSEALFQLAVEELEPDQIEALMNKPNWNVQAIGYFVPLLMDFGLFDAVFYLYETYIKNVTKLRNEHEMLVSTILDAMFELREDEARFQFMDSLVMQTEAPSLKSVAHQRLAMISAQNGDIDLAKGHLQKAMRADPNQPELPLAEMSILGLIADDEEIVSRARFWRTRLSKRYNDDYPPLEVLEKIIEGGKDYFSGMMVEEDGYSELDFDDNAAINVRSLLETILSSEFSLAYDYKVIGGEAKLSYVKPATRIFKTWKALFDAQVAKSLVVMDAEEKPQWMPDEDAAMLELWHLDDNGWLDLLRQAPSLLSSFEVLSNLSPLTGLLRMLDEESNFDADLESDVESDVAQLSNCSQLEELIAVRKIQLVTSLLERIKEHQITLPARFKANAGFWTVAEDCYFHFKGYLGTEDALVVLLEGLNQADPQHNGWLVDAMALSYLVVRKTQNIIDFLSNKKRISAKALLLLALAQQDKGQATAAIETLKLLHKRYKKDLIKFRHGLEIDDFRVIVDTPFLSIFNVLDEPSLVDYRQWIIRNLPKA